MTTKKKEGTHFPTLEAATKEMLLTDFNRCLEYRLTYHAPDEKNNVREFWTVKRKIMDHCVFCKQHWTDL